MALSAAPIKLWGEYSIYLQPIEKVGELEPLENWDHLLRELGPPCFSLKWSYLPDKVVPITRMAKLCRTIRTTLSDNWDHLVGQLEPPPLEGWGKIGAWGNVSLPTLSNTRAPSTNWGTLGLPQKAEEHYFIVQCTLKQTSNSSWAPDWKL